MRFNKYNRNRPTLVCAALPRYKHVIIIIIIIIITILSAISFSYCNRTHNTDRVFSFRVGYLPPDDDVLLLTITRKNACVCTHAVTPFLKRSSSSSLYIVSIDNNNNIVWKIITNITLW